MGIFFYFSTTKHKYNFSFLKRIFLERKIQKELFCE
ncbi:Hypothetical Protein SLY_0302 [Strawberry lethal yellows phytoplasma (CPA) str. NZSb11]|uniref:Uncharacterized protein n=1 Tax=Strawberry lethal yellows phytoplasma (CPA) str. NZSb11 TaxID=980422 RepID=R4S096_PHYAS|nr:Hypothetical Protein SLY_0302 [Strawberry lethal yellows phytoplasma (CPA) str. NZSb11]